MNVNEKWTTRRSDYTGYTLHTTHTGQSLEITHSGQRLSESMANSNRDLRLARIVPDCFHMGIKFDKFGTFKIQSVCTVVSVRQNVLKLILKCPRFGK